MSKHFPKIFVLERSSKFCALIPDFAFSKSLILSDLEKRFPHVILIITLIIALFLLHSQAAMAQYGGRRQADKPFPWPEGKKCAVSLTFDDARVSQTVIGTPLLNKYDVKATFYVLPQGMRRKLDGWKAAVKEGHEIGNHSATHPCSGNFPFSRRNALEEYTLDRITKDIQQANDVIQQQLQVTPKSFAYPCGQKYVGRGENVQSYVPIISKMFQTGRGWLGESSNNPWYCDFAQLQGVESDGKTFEYLKNLIDQAAQEGRWLVLAGHEINVDGNQTTRVDSLEKLCQYVTDPDNGIWIDTVGAIAEYIANARDREEKN